MPPSSTDQLSPPSSMTDSSKAPSTMNDSLKLSIGSKKPSPTATTSAKREIASQTLTTWTYPPSPTHPLPPNRLTPTTCWVERSPDSSSCPSPSLTTTAAPPNPYKYENPDSLATPLLSRKRKRHRMLHEEMAWNEGLRIWVERRDAWSGALPQSLYQVDGAYPLPTNGSSPLPHDCPSPPSPPPPPLLPLAPPILPPTHPIRASISPHTYPAIYSKVVVQGLSPTVPINLKDVVGAMVAGWKADGEWPPKGEGGGEVGKRVLNGSAGGKVRRGVRRVARVLGALGDGS